MKPLVIAVTPNEDEPDKTLISIKFLEQLIEQAYDAGYNDGSRKWYYYTTPYYNNIPCTTTSTIEVTCKPHVTIDTAGIGV